MIVSSSEIERVLGLKRGELVALPNSSPRIISPDYRLVHLKSLQEMCREGMYEIPPEMLAEKMLGRAICDQTRRLVEGDLPAR